MLKVEVPNFELPNSGCHSRECGNPGYLSPGFLQNLYTFRFLKTKRSRYCRVPGVHSSHRIREDDRGADFILALFLLASFLFPSLVSAATDIPSGTIISADTSWPLSGSPYIIHDGLNIGTGATLTIEAGVTIQFDNLAHIDGPGRLVAIGTPAQKILFTSTNPLGGGDGSLGSTGWYILLGSTSNTSTSSPFDFEHAIIEHSSFIEFDGEASLIRDVTIQNSDVGILFNRSQVDIDGVTITNVGLALQASNNSSGTLRHITATHAGYYGTALNFGSIDLTLSDISMTDTGPGGAISLHGGHITATGIHLDGGVGNGIYLENIFRSIEPPLVSHFDIASSTIENFASQGIRQDSGELTVTDSKILHNGNGIAVYDKSYYPPASVLVSSSTFGGNNLGVMSVSVNPPDVRGNFWGDASGPHYVLNPTGLGDDLFGTVLVNPWLTADPFFVPTFVKPDPVIIIPGLLGSAEKNGVWVVDPIFHVYDNLIATLKANGYVEGTDLFTFPYDWRNSNVDTALMLQGKIAAVLTLCHCSKVDLVAHSMGGLVARQYIESPSYQNDVDQLIFLGTPHLGAPKAYLTWEAGESTSDLSDQFIKLMLSREAKKSGYSSLFNYIHDKPTPSFQELLPTTDYLHNVGSTILKTYPTNYPRNIFLENLNANVSSLLTSGVNITNIVGDVGTSTIATIRVAPSTTLPLWQDGFPDGFDSSTSTDKGLELGRGDETVPLASSQFISVDVNSINSKHLDLPTETEATVYKKLTTKEPTEIVDKKRIYNFKLLFVKILSPADIVVIAPDGKRVGKDFTTGNELDEIPDAFYSGFSTDDEYITIPDPLDGEYKVITQGTGSGGEYTIATSLITDSSTSEASFSGQTTPGLITPISIPVNTETDTVLVVPVDNTAPTISIVSPEAKEYIRATTTIISISATSTDVDSGVFSFGLSFNGTKIKNGDKVDIYAQRLGNQVLVASSTDNVGNATSTSLIFRIIATPQSTILDVERAFALGWISKKDIKNDIISKLNQAIKIEKKIVTIEEKLPGKPKVLKQIVKLETRLDKVLGRAILKDLDAKYPKYINAQAYTLLSEDINWLINN